MEEITMVVIIFITICAQCIYTHIHVHKHYVYNYVYCGGDQARAVRDMQRRPDQPEGEHRSR